MLRVSSGAECPEVQSEGANVRQQPKLWDSQREREKKKKEERERDRTFP